MSALPTSPGFLPEGLDAAIAAAAARAESLAAAGREIDFAVGRDGELRIEVRDLRGRALRQVSPSQALGIMSGLGQI